ncbi:Isy1-like splicing factor [Tilletiaria anomala UBC 951]|uniref:Isy1-like splicing factor n=1 Tax=Tilletiaria anomala (strain ATCC 24038 / CBS 436.72 / UBC 951) TaxID=1037660 RepID=A0A066VSU3_TILAU|nr:Isy1-like splicing factor [Tilletiaria anomala UBC 951]KDN44541.1 Isy1-like splicing factor [Tilletiaria anomala UBC 951]
MARNEEKAQSMLYRFREAQAAELGFGTRKNERRPRLASSVKDLKECERWRGEVLREISRKVSKIQDFGLTDYEVRDLNDEINKLLREKNHWENQIIALGGANYKRGVPRMMDDSGKEVPGSRGYKYFGRAKDLPGVKELLERSTETEEQRESFRATKYRRFMDQSPAYYGDEDERDGVLLAEEAAEERRDWSERLRKNLLDLGCEGQELDSAEGVWPMPRAEAQAPGAPVDDKVGNKRKESKQVQGRGPKRARKDGVAGDEMNSDTAEGEGADEDNEQVDVLVSSYLFALPVAQLQAPKVPDRTEIETFLLQARKQALRSEYIG